MVVAGDGEVAAVKWQPRWCGCDVDWEMMIMVRGVEMAAAGVMVLAEWWWRGDDVDVVAMIVVRCSDGLNGGSGGVVSWRCGGRPTAGGGRSWRKNGRRGRRCTCGG
ncbi:hypothetical protein Tco_1323954 [Tanacetum coccineum]